MRILLRIIVTVWFGAALVPVQAQLGVGAGGGVGPDFSAVSKLFGDNQSFTAQTESRASGAKPGEETVVSGKLAYLDGQSRFEVDLTKMKSSKLPPGGAAKLKQTGMDVLVMIARPDKQTAYLMYPNLRAYIEKPMPAPVQAAPAPKVIELGKESFDGHACVKNKFVLTDKNGQAHEYTVWNATGLRNFPLKIEVTESGTPIVMLFRDVKFEKPEPGQFAPPATFKQFAELTELVQQAVLVKGGTR